jgi:hypothetical protein
MLIGVLIFLFVMMLLALSTFKWFRTDHHLVPGYRKTAFSIALLLGVGGACLFLAFFIHVKHIGGFGTDVPSLLRWTRTGFWMSLGALILSFSGREQSRILSSAGSMTLVIIWILTAWGP